MIDQTPPPIVDDRTQSANDATTPPKIVQLVKVVQELESCKREPTPQERELIETWMGWGPFSRAFEPSAQGHWADVGLQLRLLLGPDGFEAASAATPTSFFTDEYIGKTIWQLAIELGFAGGNVLEPGCGNGAILAQAPVGLPLQITGIEREPFTAIVAQLRFPNARILVAPLEKTAVAHSSFDLVVGNVPFGGVHIHDRDTEVQFSLHNYFLWFALQALRPGGLAILVTSRYTLDAARDQQRTLLAQYGSLLGALRLPSKAHKGASTDVITDILVLQRRSPDITWTGQPWMNLSSAAVPGLKVNEYFEHLPQHIIGTPYVGHGMYQADDLLIKAPDDIEAALGSMVADIVQQAQQHGATYLPPVDRTLISESLVRLREDGLKESSYHLMDGKLVQVIDGETRPVVKMVAELTALVNVRNAAIALLEAERNLDRPDSDLVPLRRNLNACYDAYVRTYGPVHRAKLIVGEPDPETGEQTISRRRPPAMYAFSKDPDYSVVLGLEDYDDTTQQAEKAPIFSQRVHVRPQRKMHADSPAEALALCLDEYGILDLAIIGHLLSIDPSEVPDQLGDLIYKDPVTGGWQTASEYLSGNVRSKLVEARLAAETQPEYERNVTALEAVLPEEVLPEEIKAILGAPWIGPTDLEQFSLETFGARPVISHERLTGHWEVSVPAGSMFSASAASEWGTTRLSAYRLVEIGLNKGIPTVYDTLADDTKVKNVDESLLAQDKLRVIQARFSEWVWEDNDRALRLAAVYNGTYNTIVPRTYDGSHLTFPGMSQQWQDTLYSWQKDFVWRMSSSRAALCAHPVGAGKTTTEIAGAMTLRRMGLISKAAVIVPKHLLEQITAEAQRLYPGANILMVSSEDLSKERRTLFAARIATGNYDFVVMTHSSFAALGVHPETETAYLNERMAAYREALLSLEGEGDTQSKRSIKKLEMAIEKMRQRQEALLDKPHDNGVTFEQLGISYLIVDECHLFKNLGLPTNIQGLQVKAAQRATDLEMKLRWLEAHNEGRPFAAFFTATPISNSMVEAYVLAWYLSQHMLDAYGLLTVDAFASTFIEFQTRVEVSPNGASFRLHTRPAKFVNLPEFMNLFTQFTDLRSPEILSAKRPQKREHIVTIEPSQEVQAYVDDLVTRTEEIQQNRPRSIGGSEDNMLWVTTDGRKAALDLSLVGLPQDHAPKLEAVAHSILTVYERWQQEADFLDGEFKSLQIGFCDLGTPNQESDQLYGKLKLLLVAGGIPVHGIRFIHEAKNDAAKAKLFQQCRSGAVAVLLGSTAMLGTGTNIQTRAAALHHIDAPWRPDEVEQREGRVQRPGNLYPEVEIFRYVQRRTFDAYSWQTLTNKAVFFDQLRRGKFSSREMEETGDSALSYGQVKAAATGDPLVLEQADLNVVVTHLERLRAAHARARRRDAQEASSARSYATDCRLRADRLQEIVQKAAQAATPGFTTARGRFIADRTDIGDYISDRLIALLTRQGGQEWLGHWSGVEVRLHVYKFMKEYVVDLLLESRSSTTTEQSMVRLRVYQDWVAKGQRWRFAHAIEQLLTSADATIARERAEAEEALTRAHDYEAHARDPFPQEDELHRRVARKNELDIYTALAAAAKEDPAKQADVAQRRARLLEDAPTDLSTLPVALPAKVAAPRRPEPALMLEMQPAGPELLTEPLLEAEALSLSEIAPASLPAPLFLPSNVGATYGTNAQVHFGRLEDIERIRGKRGHRRTTHTIPSNQLTLFSFDDNEGEQADASQTTLWG